ncbi:MAG: hypothetical protein RJA70_596 [Pseudomonadota bacterium]|jgi:hypothetical protein
MPSQYFRLMTRRDVLEPQSLGYPKGPYGAYIVRECLLDLQYFDVTEFNVARYRSRRLRVVLR